MKFPMYQADAFSDRLFSGNPAAVVLLNQWIEEDLMQNIAGENNLAETAFIVPDGHVFEIRWFTPLTEVDLCGHATLASAYVLFNFYEKQATTLRFVSPHSGELLVKRTDDLYELDFPLDELTPFDEPLGSDLLKGMGAQPREVYKGKSDYMLVFETQAQIEKLQPDFSYLLKADGRGIIVTAPGEEADFVSRFFAPQVGINEDPVTGSAHTSLIPYWAKRLNKNSLIAQQLSKRGGTLYCKLENNRAKIAGNATLFLKGEIDI